MVKATGIIGVYLTAECRMKITNYSFEVLPTYTHATVSFFLTILVVLFTATVIFTVNTILWLCNVRTAKKM